jgi:hypothetical protein
MTAQLSQSIEGLDTPPHVAIVAATNYEHASAAFTRNVPYELIISTAA